MKITTTALLSASAIALITTGAVAESLTIATR